MANVLTLALVFVLSLNFFQHVRTADRDDYTHLLGKPFKNLHDISDDDATSLSDLMNSLLRDKRASSSSQNVELVKRQIFQMPRILAAFINTSSECRTAFYSIGPSVLEMINGKIPFWVVAMLDSTGKFTSGTMRGSRIRTGSYNQCVRIDVDERKGFSPHFRGKMCTVVADYVSSAKNYRVWELQNNNIYPAVPCHDTYETQICVPSVCTEQDVIHMFNTVAKVLGENDLDVKSIQCYYHRNNTFSSWTIFVFILLGILCIIFALGTLYEILISFQAKTGVSGTLEHNQNIQNIKNNMGPVGRTILAFSIPNNLYNVLTANVNERSYKAINGIRFFTVCWVILANVYYVGKDMEWKNYAGLLEDLRSTTAQVIINARFAADTTFCFSGLLVAVVTLKRIRKDRGRFNVLRFYFHRILRLIPVYMGVMIFATAFYFHMGEGVQWMNTNEYQTECGKHWWKGLLFINNFFSSSDKCVPLSWYVAADFQLFLVAPIVLYPLYGFPKLALGLLGVEIIIANAIPIILTELNSLPYFIGRKFFLHPHHEDYLNLILYKPWGHAGAYLVGILYGYLLYARGNRTTMKPMMVAIGWTISISIPLVLLFGFKPYIDGTSEMPKLLGLLYTSSAGTLWAISLGWIAYACAAGYGGFIDNFLSSDFFLSTGKMTFVVYLVQNMAVHNFLDSRPDIYYYDLWIIVIIFCGCTFTSFVLSIFANTVIYEPIRQLEEIWLLKRYSHRIGNIVHFAVTPTSSSSEDELDESIKKLIVNADNDDDDIETSLPIYTKNGNNVLGNVDLGKQFKVYQNGADVKKPEEEPLLVANQ